MMGISRPGFPVRRAAIRALLPLAQLLAHAPVACQSADEGEALLREQVLVTPSPVASIRSGAPSVFLSGSTSETTASVEAGFEVLDDPTFGNVFATLGLSAPLSGGDETVLADLEGLSGGSRLSLSLTGMHWPWEVDDVENTEWCEKKKTQGRVDTAYVCANFDLTDLVEEDRALEREYYMEVDPSVPVLYELSASVMPEEMSFLDAATLEPGTRDGTSASLGGSIGRFFGTQLLAVGYRHEVAFDQSPETEVCTPLGIDDALRCRNARIGEPLRRESGVGSVQARGFLRRNLAWNPRLTYRFSDSDWIAELPLYFVPGEDGLIGGIAPAFSEDDGWTVRVFVGKAFRTGL